MDYVSIGNTMTDSIVGENGEVTSYHMGGPGPFAYNGIRLWTDSCLLVSNVGKDYDDFYGDWMRDNNISYDGVYKNLNKTHNMRLVYNEDGTYSAIGYSDDKSYLDIRASDATARQIEKHTKGAKAVYFFMEIDNRKQWEDLAEVKRKNGFAMMWEIYMRWYKPEKLPQIKKVLKDMSIEMLSLNYPETMKLFEVEGREKCIEMLKTLNVPFVIMRDGANGMYVIEGDKHWLIPSVVINQATDPTGCGNCSSGAAMYAYHATKDPIMAGIMANISSAYNLDQYGLAPLVTEDMRAHANALAKKLYEEYTLEEI